MIVENLHMVMLPTIIDELHKLNSPETTIPKTSDIPALSREAYTAIKPILDTIPRDSVLKARLTTIIWKGKTPNKDNSIEKLLSKLKYKYTYDTYQLALVTPTSMVLWNGHEMKYSNTIMNNSTTAPVCRYLFEKMVNQVLIQRKLDIPYEDFEEYMSSLPTEDYIFKRDNGYILTQYGFISADMDTSVIDVGLYFAYVKSRITSMLK